MRKQIIDAVQTLRPYLGERVCELGSLRVQEEFDLRSIFPKLFGVDMQSGLGVDLVADATATGLESGSFDAVLCLETLEHAKYPTDVIRESRRIVKPGGVLVISSQMFFPVHNYPSDYWRFTPDGFCVLLEDFRFVTVVASGPSDLPHTVIGIASDQQLVPAFVLDDWRKKWNGAGRWWNAKNLVRLWRDKSVWG